MKLATTIEEQILLLQGRGMQISDIEKAKEILADIGYYRLGFYWYPFEVNVKNLRIHNFKENTKFESVVDLYYFDHDVRKLILPYIQRVEVNFRTFLIYCISNIYKDDPTWFVNNCYVSDSFITKFQKVYDEIRVNPTIKKHYIKYPKDTFAPAWKTLEYATFGTIIVLYDELKSEQIRSDIALHYGISNLKVFDSYLNTIRRLRNICAHGHTIFDMRLPKPIKPGPLNITGDELHNTIGAIKVLDFFLQSISINRSADMKKELSYILKKFSSTEIYPLVSYISGIDGVSVELL
jgi:abortive infection bacteriophage resistance protein